MNLSFQNRVYKVVKSIAKGETLTYKQVAVLAARPKAFRAVGNILNKNHDLKIPCHRVIRSDGSLGGYSGKGGVKTKRALLIKEGIKI